MSKITMACCSGGRKLKPSLSFLEAMVGICKFVKVASPLRMKHVLPHLSAKNEVCLGQFVVDNK
jgi:hypothetical protein